MAAVLALLWLAGPTWLWFVLASWSVDGSWSLVPRLDPWIEAIGLEGTIRLPRSPKRATSGNAFVDGTRALFGPSIEVEELWDRKLPR